MKITNLKLDMFNWYSEPWMTGVGTQFGSTRQLGVVTVETDEGVSGNSFLGSSRMGADHFALGLIEFIKPIVIGRNPLDIGAIWARHVQDEPLRLNLRHRRRRRLPLGHQRQARRTAHPQAPRHLQGLRARLLQHCLLGRPRKSTSKRPSDSGTWAGPHTRFTPTATLYTTSRSARP